MKHRIQPNKAMIRYKANIVPSWFWFVVIILVLLILQESSGILHEEETRKLTEMNQSLKAELDTTIQRDELMNTISVSQ